MSGRGFIKEAILASIGPDDCKVTVDIAAAVGRSANKVAGAVGEMIVHGLVERIERGCYRLTPEGRALLASGAPIKSGPRGPHSGARRPNPDTLRQRAWSAMRLMTTFTTVDILLRAAKPDETACESNLARYLRALIAAGLIVETPRRSFVGQAPSSNGCKVYRLIKDIGEIAPRMSERRGLIDLNRGAA